MIKLLLFIIPLIINIIILFTEKFETITFIILFNLVIIFIFLLNKNFFKSKSEMYIKQDNEHNLFSEQESAQDHPIIVSARKRLKK